MIKIKRGGGLVFELSECNANKIKFKIQIQWEDILAELVPKDVEGINTDTR